MRDFFLGDVRLLGWLYTVSSVGSVITSILMGRLPRIRHRGLIAYGSFLLWSLAFVVIGFWTELISILICMFLIGGLISMFGMVWVNTLQEMVPNDKLGRVSSLDMLGSFALLPVGFGLVGWASDWLGSAQIFWLSGLISAVLAILGLMHPDIRKLD